MGFLPVSRQIPQQPLYQTALKRYLGQVRSKIILHLNSNSSGISRSYITVSGYILEFKDKKEKAREENTILKHTGGHLYLDIIYTQGVLKI